MKVKVKVKVKKKTRKCTGSIIYVLRMLLKLLLISSINRLTSAGSRHGCLRGLYYFNTCLYFSLTFCTTANSSCCILDLLIWMKLTNTIQRKLKVTSTQLLYQSAPYQAVILFATGPFVDQLLTNRSVFAHKYTAPVLVCIQGLICKHLAYIFSRAKYIPLHNAQKAGWIITTQ